ncbi:MAG: hypothetical protein AABN33_06530 [Acidobacteriota bacterium]
MPSNSTKQSVRASRSMHDAFLVTLISLIAVGSALGGFLIGRHITRDAFIDRVSTKGAFEKTTLVSTGSPPLSLFQIVGNRIDDPLMAEVAVSLLRPLPTRSIGDQSCRGLPSRPARNL